MNGKFNYFIIFVSVSILSFVSIPGQCESSDKEINIYSTFGTPTKLPKSLESPNGKYIAILKIVEGGVRKKKGFIYKKAALVNTKIFHWV